MSNYKCPECGMINIDCGKEGYKTPREIELEEENETLKSLNKHLTENGLFSQRHFKEENERLKEKLKIALNSLNYIAILDNNYIVAKLDAEQALQKIKEVKND